MRAYHIVIPLLVIAGSCTKSGNNPSIGNPPGNPSGNPPVGTGSKITVNSVSPSSFYTDEQITIKGTGFDPDKTKDTVEFGILTDASDTDTTKVFGVNHTEAAGDFIIVSATATQLVIKATKPDTLFNQVSGRSSYSSFANGALGVKSNGSLGVSPRVMIKNIPYVSSFDILTYSHPLVPGDSLALVVGGLSGNNLCDVSVYFSCSKTSNCGFIDQYLNNNIIGGPVCDCGDFGTLIFGCNQGGSGAAQGRIISFNSDLGVATVAAFLPADFFGPNTHRPSVVNVTAKAINKEGRSGKVAVFPIQVSPDH